MNEWVLPSLLVAKNKAEIGQIFPRPVEVYICLKASAKKLGVKVTDIFWTLGPFDGLLVLEAPDDETATALMLHLGSLGNIQTQTARAFTASEMEKILEMKTK